MLRVLRRAPVIVSRAWLASARCSSGGVAASAAAPPAPAAAHVFLAAAAAGAAAAGGAGGFSSLGVPPSLVSSLRAAGLTSPTPAQTLALPRVLAGGDTSLRAETGGGKTLVYALPLLAAAEAALAEPRGDGDAAAGVVGAVLVPTQELARQVRWQH